MKKTKFKVGDKVQAHGLNGVIMLIDNDPDCDYPLIVNLEVIGKERFTLAGLSHITHKDTELKLVSSSIPKKKKLFIAVETIIDYGSRLGGHKTSHAYPEKYHVEDMFNNPQQIIEIEIETED